MLTKSPIQLIIGRLWPFLAPVLLVTSVVGLCSLGTESQQRTATMMLVNLVIVVGLQIFVGNSGILSFGHAGFMAIGAYGTALLTIPTMLKAYQLPHLPAVLAGAHVSAELGVLLPALAAGIIGLAVAAPIMRLSGLPASIVTFSLLVISFTVINNWTALTAGPAVLGGMPFDVTLTRALGWAVVAMVVAYLFNNSRHGLRLQASREDEPAARGIGINVRRERTIAFALSGCVVGIGGALFAHVQGSIDPSAFFLAPTFIMLVMLVVGGINSYAGAVIGTVVVSILLEGLRVVEEGVTVGPVVLPARPNLRELVLGGVLILVLVLRPRGIMGSREIEWPLRNVCARSRLTSLPRLTKLRRWVGAEGD